MAEYIEREAACGDCIHTDVCERVPLLAEFSRENPAYCKLFRPAADVVEVVHGRWLKTEEPLGWHEVDCIGCSACHDSWIADEDYGLDFADFWKYCPNCGARMDGES